jgi:hypothetical protein
MQHSSFSHRIHQTRCYAYPATCCNSAGTCAANGGKVFYFNPDRKPLEHKENKLWFHNYTTKADGRVEGNGANDGLIRTVAQGSKEPVRSMMIVEMKTGCEYISWHSPGRSAAAATRPVDQLPGGMLLLTKH